MKPISLEDLKPQSAEFYLRGPDRTYRIRPINLADEAWMKRTFGAELAQKTQDPEGLCQILFHQLEDEDKKDFSPVERDTFDEDGNPVKEKIGGWRLLMSKVSGLPEQVGMSKALLQARGFSAPLIDEMVRDELKKKEIQESPSLKPTGDMSSTFLPQNTVGPLSRSGDSLGAKSTSPSGESRHAEKQSSPSKPKSMAQRSSSKSLSRKGNQARS
jgi:hypothetical protein